MLRPVFGLILSVFLFGAATLASQPTALQTGAQRTDLYLPLLQNKRVALVVNHTSLIDSTHLVDTLLRLGIDIRVVFAPEHGFRGLAEAGETIRDSQDTRSGISLKSLYGKKTKPSAKDLKDIDVVIFDIQDIGARFYTYISTLLKVQEACAEQNKILIVLDRPNPNGHYIDGPVLEPHLKSFVGVAPIPIVHGCTVGELARMFAGEKWFKSADRLQLTVIPCAGYTHQTRYTLPVKPSPNIPDQRSVLLYPTICLFEGTKVSVGRGTDTPFQRFGYPDFAAGEISFIPCPNAGAQDPLHNGMFCNGYDLSNMPLDSLYAHPAIDLHWLIHFFKNSPRKDDFFLKNDFFSLLAGTRSLRIQIEQGQSEDQIRASWQLGLDAYKAVRSKYLLYE